jgi:Ion channel
VTDRSSRIPTHRSFASRLAEGDTYGTLLIFIIVTYVMMALVEDTKWSRTIVGACFAGTLLLALHTSHVRGRIIRIVGVLVAVSVVWQGVLAATDHEPFHGASYIFVLLIVACPVVILIRIFRHPVINVETVLGAIDAYLLLGISFAAIYGAIDGIDPHFFQQGAATGVQYLYFSFVVITTLGFGDFTPATDIGRVVVSLEALMGQLFLVTVVAVLVANLGRAARHGTKAEGIPETDDAHGDE